MRHRIAALAVVLAIAGCQRKTTPTPPVPTPHYVVGSPWQGEPGTWFYPKEQLDYHATGLAVVEQPHGQALTADGEIYDAEAVAASHQTLQLPSILHVTNLENGRSILVRVNDRGPPGQGRLLALTKGTARLLDIQPGSTTRIDIAMDTGLSRRLAEQSASGPHLDIATAPVEGVQEQALGAAGMSGPATVQSPAPGSGVSSATDEARVPDHLPPRLQQGRPDPGALWIDAGQFNQRSYADEIATSIGGSVRSDGQGRQIVYSVRAGPFQRTSDADAALDQARRAGVTGARIIVE
ncbi:MAG: RlpA-like double-psi beta-barrel domain-containing protein [Janthinobacterium lividum]